MFYSMRSYFLYLLVRLKSLFYGHSSTLRMSHDITVATHYDFYIIFLYESKNLIIQKNEIRIYNETEFISLWLEVCDNISNNIEAQKWFATKESKFIIIEFRR